ncbi:MAG: hypothetical protein R6V49_10455 [Bacteroidales bacterium]
MIEAIERGLDPYRKLFRREITRDDILRLTEIKIKRISKYDSFKADEVIKSIEDDIAEVKHHLAHLTDYAIAWFERLLKKYGAGKERRTEIRNFETIEATSVAVANARLYVDREEGFAGIGLKKADFVCECSDIDDIIVFRRDGTCLVTKVADKIFVGKDVIHIDVFKRNDERTIYNLVYRDGTAGFNYVKRFAVTGVTRDKEYQLTKGTNGSRVLYFTANPNGEAEVIKVLLRPKARLRKLNFEFDFKELAIKGRSSQGNVISRYAVKSIVKKEEGISTLGAVNVWFDDSVRRLNHDQRGLFLGAFKQDDKILVLYRNGDYKVYGYDLSTHFDDDLLHIRKFNPDDICNAVYTEAETGFPYLKRFSFEGSDKRQSFIGGGGSVLISAHFAEKVDLTVQYAAEKGSRNKTEESFSADGFITVKSIGAKGKRISKHHVAGVIWSDMASVELEAEEETVNEEVDEPAGEMPEKGSGQENQATTAEPDGSTSVSMDKEQGIQMELEL